MENKPQGLKLSSDFSILLKSGRRKILSPWLMISYKVNECEALRFGCTISKKVGSAVIRNKLKRWTREYFLELYKEPSLQPAQNNRAAKKNENIPKIDINLVFRPRSDEFYKALTFSEFRRTLDTFFRKRG